MIELALNMWSGARGPALGPELRATGATVLVGVAAAATYNTTTGEGTATRVDFGNQSYVHFTGLNGAGTYRLDIRNTGANQIAVRRTSYGGTVIQNVNAGQSAVIDCAMAGTTVLAVNSSVSTAAFTVNSLRKVG